MTDTIALDEKYCTTRLVTREKPEVANSLEDKFETVLFLPEGEGRKGEGGLRTKGYFKKSYQDKPLISIITVVFNGEKFLEETIQSIINQTYDNVEYIIIDGGSTDGTLDIIKKYEDRIDYWVSEGDRGIYDAMNKGLDVASGDWINFMNAGDKLFFIPYFKNIKDADLVYGKAILSNGKVLIYNKNVKFKNFSRGMVVCHQSCFYNKEYYKKSRYDLKYKICADQKFTALAIKSSKAFYIDQVIAYYDLHGISSQNDLEIMIEKIKLNYEIGLNIFAPFLSFLITKAVKIRDKIWSKTIW
jgi:hypothetical protein